jgi:MerR family transcriptional regulator, copper efflux regulator
MLIGELAQRCGLSRDTIRFYEKKGLIEVPESARKENNYKDYSGQTLNRLQLIQTAKALGFNLAEIKTLFSDWNTPGASCATEVHTLENKIKDIDAQIHKLVSMKLKLTESLSACRNNNCEFEKVMPACN